MRTFRLVIFVSVLFSFIGSSCLSPRKMDQRIAKYYGNTIPAKGRKSDYINFKFTNTIPDADISGTEKTKSKMLPLLFYWKWDITKTSIINTMMPMSNFTSSFITEANAKGLKEKLKGGTVEITINNNPSSFNLRDEGWMVYLILGYIGKDKFYIDPLNENLSVAYTVSYPSGESKTGNLSVRNINLEKSPRFFQSIKGMLNEYLAASDANIKLMAKELAGKLVTEINGN